MEYEKSSWFFNLHNIFKIRDSLSSEQSYRRIIDNIEEFDELYLEGISPQQAYEEFWN